jgi:site-specific recombinase XerD
VPEIGSESFREVIVAGYRTVWLTSKAGTEDGTALTRRLRLSRRTRNATDPDYASMQFEKYARMAGLIDNLRFHSQRHTTPAWLLHRGTPLTIVKSHMGHVSVQTTVIYNHDDQQLTSAAI